MDRERITISIKKSVLDRVDEMIDGTAIRNRSHAFESLVLNNLGGKENERVVVLLGGDDALKNIPAVEKFFSQLNKSGYSVINIATGFLGDKVKAKLGDGSKYNLSFVYNNEGEGSGGALYVLKKELKHTFVVVNIDEPTDLDLKKLLKFHRKHSGTATIATTDLDTLNGIYVFEPEIFESLPKGFSMLEDEVIPKLVRDEKVVVYPIATQID